MSFFRRIIFFKFRHCKINLGPADYEKIARKKNFKDVSSNGNLQNIRLEEIVKEDRPPDNAVVDKVLIESEKTL